jgi:hypothetical protein
MSRNQPGFGDWDALQVQNEFFLGILPAEGGRFHFLRGALKAGEGTIVLFQYAGVIVASAKLLGVERYGKRKTINGIIFRGAYLFDPLSIRTFAPVDGAMLRKYWPKFVRLGQAKQTLSPASTYAKFRRSLRRVRSVNTGR